MKREDEFSIAAALAALWDTVKYYAVKGSRAVSAAFRKAVSAVRERMQVSGEKRLARRQQRAAAAVSAAEEKTEKAAQKRDKAASPRRKSARRRGRREERARNEYRSRTMRRIAWHMVLATLIYWGFVFVYVQWVQYDSIVVSLEGAVWDLLESITGSSFMYDVYNSFDVIIIIAYIVLMLALPLRALYRAAGHVDRIYTAAAAVLEPELAVPEVPRDVRDIGTALREIKVTMTQSEQSAKEAEQRKNDLVVYLAHDLKTPLASIIGYLTLLEEAPELPIEQRAKYTAITLNKAYRLEQLINEFFDITRFNLQSVELERNRVDLSILFEQIADEFFPVLEEKELGIVLDVEPQLRMVGDSDKLGRVFDNLLRNAVSYSYWGTDIRISAWRQEENVVISFRNTGDEIPPNNLERLFEKFFRVDAARRTSTGGSGLGLAIAKQIVELHGGTITAYSSREYTEFVIILPAAPAKS